MPPLPWVWGGLTCEPLYGVLRLQPEELLPSALELVGEGVELPVGLLLQGLGTGQGEALGHHCSHNHNHEGGRKGSTGHMCGGGGEVCLRGWFVEVR